MSDTEDRHKTPESPEHARTPEPVRSPEPAKKALDHHGLQPPSQLEPQEEVIYDVREEPAFQVTRALFIGNLRRPINAIDFQNYLKELAAQTETVVERAWLNRSRTHGIVLVDKEDGAQYIREKLNGARYPLEEGESSLKIDFDNRENERYQQLMKQYEEQVARADDPDSVQKPAEPAKFNPERFDLYVDYIPVKAINQWIYEEDRGPTNGKWKILYETKDDEIFATHTLLFGDFVPRYNPRGGRRGRGGFRGRGRPSFEDRGGPRPYGLYPPRPGHYAREGGRDNHGGRDFNSRDSYGGRGDYGRDSYGGRGDYGRDSYNDGYRDLHRNNGPRDSYGGYGRDNYGPREGYGDSYVPKRRYERDSYVPGNREENDYSRDDFRSRRTDSYRPRDRSPDRARSRSPSRE